MKKNDTQKQLGMKLRTQNQGPCVSLAIRLCELWFFAVFDWSSFDRSDLERKHDAGARVKTLSTVAKAVGQKPMGAFEKLRDQSSAELMEPRAPTESFVAPKERMGKMIQMGRGVFRGDRLRVPKLRESSFTDRINPGSFFC